MFDLETSMDQMKSWNSFYSVVIQVSGSLLSHLLSEILLVCEIKIFVFNVQSIVSSLFSYPCYLYVRKDSSLKCYEEKNFIVCLLAKWTSFERKVKNLARCRFNLSDCLRISFDFLPLPIGSWFFHADKCFIFKQKRLFFNVAKLLLEVCWIGLRTYALDLECF